jgi:hypothetical protein
MIYYISVGFQVLTAVTVMRSIFWNITLCSPTKLNRRFGGTYSLRTQGGRVSQARNQHYAAESRVLPNASFCLFLDPESVGGMFLLILG